MNLSVTRGRIVVSIEKDEYPSATESKNSPLTGRILAFGKGRQLESGREADLGLSLQKNIKVLFPKGVGSEVQYDGGPCLILDYNDILGVVPEPTPSPASVTNPAVQDPPKKKVA